MERTSWPPVSNTQQSIADLLRLESMPVDLAGSGDHLDPIDEGQGDGSQGRMRFDSGGSYDNAGYVEGGLVPSSPPVVGPDEAPLLANEESGEVRSGGGGEQGGRGDAGGQSGEKFTVL